MSVPDPRSELYTDRARAESFGAIASDYDRFRPPHSPEMIETLVSAGPRTALDVACGTGKVAAMIASHGVDVLGVEVDERMAAVARTHGITVEIASFEAWEDRGRRFDLLTIGSAWHWIDPEAGTRKAAAVLHPGGTFARFWSYHLLEEPLVSQLDAVYRRVAPDADVHGYHRRQRRALIEDVVAQSPEFGAVERRTWETPHTLTADEWVGLCATYSDHQRLTSENRAELFGELREVIAANGGDVPTLRSTLALITRRV